MILIFISAITLDIVQIAAACGEKEINIYLTPKSSIGLEASAATGLTYVGGVMKHYDRVVEHTDPSEGLQQFKSVGCNPILVGHNIQSFDLPILMNQLVKYRLFDSFAGKVFGFIDTLKVSKTYISKKDVENFKQVTLVRTFVGKDYEAQCSC